MKKYLKITLLIIVIIFLLVIFIYNYNSKENIHFYNEYKNKTDIKKDNIYTRITPKESIKLLKEKTGILYFGYPDCPWCQNLVPILDEVSKENGIKNIYYIDNFYKMRPDKNKNPINSKEYNEIVKILGPSLVEMKNKDNKYNIIRVPLVVFVVNGEIVDSHLGTLSNHDLVKKNGKYYLKKLSKKQKIKLKKILTKKIDKISSITCTSKKGC